MENYKTSININQQNGTLEMEYSGNINSFRNEEMKNLINIARTGWVKKVILNLSKLEAIELSILNGLVVLNHAMKFYRRDLEIIVAPSSKTKKLVHQTKFDLVLPLSYGT